MALLARGGDGQFIEVSEMGLMRADGGRCGVRLTFQTTRWRGHFQIRRIAAKIAVAGVASFRAVWFCMAGRAGIVDFFRAVILAVAAFARSEIVVDAFDIAAVRRHEIRGMRIARVAGFARDIRDAAVELAAVTLPAFAGIVFFARQRRAVKVSRSGHRPASSVDAHFLVNAGGRILRIAASDEES